jgi:hypothetical protein
LWICSQLTCRGAPRGYPVVEALAILIPVERYIYYLILISKSGF